MTPAKTVETSRRSAAELRSAHRERIFPCVAPYYSEPLVLAGGEGCRVVDAEGREYLDLFAGILTTSIGHCHPEVTARVTEQLQVLGHTSTMYVTPQQVEVAERLAQLAPGDLEKAFFTNSGSEAVETAIMLARMYTGREEVIALRYAYSGRTLLATNVTAHGPWRPLASSVAWIKHALAPYCYRCAFGPPCDGCAAKYAADLEEVILTTTNGRPAAFIAEPILGVGGFIVPPAGYFQLAAEVIRKHGGLFIADEVQTGFGRTGGRWFGIEHWGVEPDIVILAKGIANGFPVGATLARAAIADAWMAKTISTYGGNPVSMAAAAAPLDVMVREDVPARSDARGAQLRQGLESVASEYDWIGDVRGMGLMQALELVEDPQTKEPSPRLAAALLEAAREEGLLVGIGGLHGNVVRIGPSMLIGAEEIAEGLDRLRRACGRADRAR
jgi:4-aminobutyrate aminotransferase-like enzyme